MMNRKSSWWNLGMIGLIALFNSSVGSQSQQKEIMHRVQTEMASIDLPKDWVVRQYVWQGEDHLILRYDTSGMRGQFAQVDLSVSEQGSLFSSAINNISLPFIIHSPLKVSPD